MIRTHDRGILPPARRWRQPAAAAAHARHNVRMRHVRVIVSGAVQGVGFRYSAHDAAARLGVAGWIRNRRDGTVEAELHGEQGRVDRMIDWLRKGPSAAHVERVEVSEATPTGPLSFDIREDA